MSHIDKEKSGDLITILPQQYAIDTRISISMQR